MNIEEKIEEFNLLLDDEETQIKAKALKIKLFRVGLIVLSLSIAFMIASIIIFILLMILGLKTLNPTILYSIIPFATLVFSTFGIMYGYSYLRLSKQIIIQDEKNE